MRVRSNEIAQADFAAKRCASRCHRVCRFTARGALLAGVYESLLVPWMPYTAVLHPGSSRYGCKSRAPNRSELGDITCSLGLKESTPPLPPAPRTFVGRLTLKHGPLSRETVRVPVPPFCAPLSAGSRWIRCHGILLQLPVPSHLDPRGLLGAIKVEKDVECFNPTNAGRMTAWRRTVIAPCTPLGVMEMLLRLGVEVQGKHAVVLGESSVVGLPMCLLLNEARATVSMVHKETPNPEEFTRRADIVVAATGVPELVRAGWIKRGAVVVDVGINFVRDDERPEGFRVVGDVHPDVREVASIVSPVPGGVGPMTIAMLMRNCANMAFLQSRWGTIAGALHPDLAAENARRMHAAIVDLAWRGSEALSSRGGGDDGGEDTGHPGGVLREVEVAREKALGRAGDSISDAELLTIINDSEKNAFGLLSFLELGSSHVGAGAGVTLGEEGEGGEGGSSRTMQPLRNAGGNRSRQDQARGGESGSGDGGGDGRKPLGSGEEGPMKALDEWHLEAEKAAKDKGEAVSPHSEGQALLLEEESEGLVEGKEWWEGGSGRSCAASSADAKRKEREGRGHRGGPT